MPVDTGGQLGVTVLAGCVLIDVPPLSFSLHYCILDCLVIAAEESDKDAQHISDVTSRQKGREEHK